MTGQPITPEMQTWIDQSQGMVRAIASKIFSTLPPQVSYDDLVSYGQLGLMQAANSFDPSLKVSFQTFAYYRIRGAIYDGLGKMSWTSRAVSQRLRAERLSAELLEQQVVASAADGNNDRSSLAADADWIVKSTERLTLVHLLADSSDGHSASGLDAPDTQARPDEIAAQREVHEILRKLVESLPATEHELIRLSYFEGKTLAEAAEILGRSRSWGSRVHARILEKLGRCLAAQGAC